MLTSFPSLLVLVTELVCVALLELTSNSFKGICEFQAIYPRVQGIEENGERLFPEFLRLIRKVINSWRAICISHSKESRIHWRKLSKKWNNQKFFSWSIGKITKLWGIGKSVWQTWGCNSMHENSDEEYEGRLTYDEDSSYEGPLILDEESVYLGQPFVCWQIWSNWGCYIISIDRYSWYEGQIMNVILYLMKSHNRKEMWCFMTKLEYWEKLKNQ